MFRPTKRVLSRTEHGLFRVLVTALAAVSFAAIALLAAERAQACPVQEQAGEAQRIHDTVERVVTLSGTVMAAGQIGTADVSQAGGQCCGGGCQSHGVGCAIACCSACGTAIVVVTPGLVLTDIAIGRSMRNQGDVASAKPPPNLRPPRTFV